MRQRSSGKVAKWQSGKWSCHQPLRVGPPASATRYSLLATRSSRGFTLVEMLVAVALTLVIMTMFATAFQIAAGVMLRQRGIAENDQRARSVVTMLRGDLQKRTYRQRSDANTETIFIFGDALLNNSEEAFENRLANTANRNGLGIVPLHPDYFIAGVGGTGREVDGEMERGYFYISENDPFNDADDVLQFTMDAAITALGNDDTSPFTGRARPLGAGGAVAPTWAANNAVNTDQPIWDDGKGFKINSAGAIVPYAAEDTGTSQSRFAELTLFIRNGKLIRRMLLIRDPALPNPPGPDQQPTRSGGAEFIEDNYAPNDEDVSPTAANTSDFFNDFDFSATRLDPPEVATARLRFNTAENLDNLAVTTSRNAIGNPRNRFGHDHSPVTNGLQGRPKEHLRPDDSSTFMGRYTHGETSDARFLFPGQLRPGLQPFQPGFIGTESNGDYKVDQFDQGPREGEDILMTNVHSFDVKVWDAALSAWVDMGHQQQKNDYDGDGDLTNDIPQLGDWHLNRVFPIGVSGGEWEVFTVNGSTGTPIVNLRHSARRSMYRYGSLDGILAENGVAFNRIFDTWHPQFNFNTTTDGGAGDVSQLPLDDPPPFRPLWTDRDNFDVESLDPGNLPLPDVIALVRSNPTTFNLRSLPVVWSPDTPYALPFPHDGSDVFDLSQPPCRAYPQPRVRTDNPPAGLSPNDETYPGHQSMFYQVVEVSDLGLGAPDEFLSGSTPPAWPAVAGEEVQDGEIRWRAFNNTIGLQAIQITVRFLDPTSQQMRQVTIIHPMVELQ